MQVTERWPGMRLLESWGEIGQADKQIRYSLRRHASDYGLFQEFGETIEGKQDQQA